jgi:Na+/proline symporter
MFLGLEIADFLVLTIYLVLITLLGAWAGHGAKNVSEFFMPRRFGKLMMLMNAFGTGTASDQAVTVASATYRSGLSGIWYQWLWLFVTPFYWLIAPLFRRFRAVTTAEVYELRFDRSVALLFAIVGIASLAVKIGVLLRGTGALMEACTGASVSTHMAIVATAIMFVVYGTAGGLSGAIVTDFVQGFLTLFFSFILLPFVLAEVGWIAGVKDTINDPAMMSLVAPGKITWFFVIMMAVQALVGIVAQPFIMGICGAGKTEFEGRVGMVAGNFVKRICTMAWSITAIAGVAWYMQSGATMESIDPDTLYGNLAQAFLPQLAPGVLGLFLAAMLAAVMSSCDAFMLSSAALFTQNVYRPMRAGQTESHYLLVGRVAGIFVVVGGILFALWVPNVIKALEIWFMIAPMMGIAFWLGLFWRRLSVAGAWASTLAGFATWYVTTRSGFIAAVAGLPQADTLRLVWEAKGGLEIYLPWQILMYMTAAILAGIIVSLITRPVSNEKLRRFYDLTRTPVQPGEEIVNSCELPAGVAPAQRRMLTTALGLEVPMPSLTSWLGFSAGWLGVAVIMLLYVTIWR